jgi:hypothetical protein
MVMADSGHQISTGYLDFTTVYTGMIDTELARPAGADLWAVANRVGNHYKVGVRVRNRLGSTLTASMSPTVHVIVYEEARVGVTNAYVRAASSASITSLEHMETASFLIETADITPLDWTKVKVVVMADYRPGSTSGAYDMLQAAQAWMGAPRPGDYDGDGVPDAAVYRPSSGTWFWLKSSALYQQFTYKGWGVQASGDLPVPGDFDGDGVIDPTVYRPSTGTWFVLKSGSHYAAWSYFGWGDAADTPLTGDFDGDGLADAAVYRPSTGQWFIRPSSAPGAGWNVVFGQSGDLLVPADYDGDKKTDIAVYRPSTGTWFVLKSSSNFTAYEYRGYGVQAEGDTPVPADYDGDGKADPAVFRASTGTWFILESHAGYSTFSWYGWGTAGDVLLPADYDGDRKADAAVFRPSTGEWFVKPSSGSPPVTVVFGQAGDMPLK